MTDLTTLSSYKLYAGVTVDTADKALSALITQVSAAIEAKLNRHIGTAAYTETWNGTGGTRHVLREFPITAVSAVVVDGVQIPARPSVTGAGYSFSDIGLFLQGYEFTRGFQNCQATFTAGYQTIPSDLEAAANKLVLLAYRRRDHMGLTSKGLQGETTAYLSDAMPKDVMAVLNQYARVTL